MAALFAFYRGGALSSDGLIGERQGVPYPIRDEARVLELFASAWLPSTTGACSQEFCAALVLDLLGREDFWGCLPNDVSPAFVRDVAQHLHAICSVGVRPALERLLG
jgi:hypothetical protein